MSRGNPLQANRTVLQSNLTAREKLTLLALLDHWPDCRPSFSRLAQWTSTSRRRVIDQLQSLARRGIIELERRDGLANRYHLRPGWEAFVPRATSDATSPAESTELVTPRHQGSDATSPDRGHSVTSTSDATSPEANKEATKGSKQGKRATRARWTVVPSSWQPRETHTQLAAQLGVNLRDALAQFRDHEFRTPKSDADRAFANWLRREKGFQRGTGPQKPQQPNHPAAHMPATRTL